MAQGTLKRKPLRDALRSRHTHKDKAHKRGALPHGAHECERCARVWHERALDVACYVQAQGWTA